MTIISSGIYPIDPTITDGTQLAGYINKLVEAINSNQSSSTRPPMITKGGLWTKNLTGSDIAIMVYDGTNDVEIGKVTGGEIIIGGDSATLESLGIPNHDKIEVSENGNTKFTKPVTIRNEGGEALRFERTGYDVMDLNLSEDGFRFRNVTKSTTPVLINSDGNVKINSAGKDDALYVVGGIKQDDGPGNPWYLGKGVLGSTTSDFIVGNNNNKIMTITEAGAVKIQDNVIQTTSSVAQLSLRKGASGEEFVLNNDVSGNTGISTKGNIVFNSNGSARLSLLGTGSMRFDNVSVWGTTASAGNLYVDPSSGLVSRSTATMYSAEEVDNKLAIKDKLIEKLEARLKKIEDQLKKKKK